MSHNEALACANLHLLQTYSRSPTNNTLQDKGEQRFFFAKFPAVLFLHFLPSAPEWLEKVSLK